MRRRSAIRLLSCAAMLGATGAAAAGEQAAGSVPVYDATQVAFDRYTVVKRVGTDDWQSAFYVPGHRDLETAQQAVVSAAARAGADGVVNLTCFDQTDGIFKRAGYFCYGNAIKIRK